MKVIDNKQNNRNVCPSNVPSCLLQTNKGIILYIIHMKDNRQYEPTSNTTAHSSNYFELKVFTQTFKLPIDTMHLVLHQLSFLGWRYNDHVVIREREHDRLVSGWGVPFEQCVGITVYGNDVWENCKNNHENTQHLVLFRRYIVWIPEKEKHNSIYSQATTKSNNIVTLQLTWKRQWNWTKSQVWQTFKSSRL